MKRIFAVVLALIAFSSFAMPAFASVRLEGGMYIVDDAEGYAPIKNGKKTAAREEAKRMAYRDALEKALGACVTGITEMENFAVTRDKVFSKASGIVKDFKIVSERVDDDGVLTLTGVCRVAERALDGALGPDVIAMLGNPRIMILVDERIGEKTPFISTTESEALRIFEKAGYLIVDPDQARTLLHLDPASAFDDPVKLSEAARTLKADIIIVGRAFASAFAKQKIQGITLYGVKGTVQLKAVLTKTAYQISSKTIEQSTGKKPAQTEAGGAERCFKQATAQAAEQIVYKIAYSMASAGSAMGGVTVNIKIANASFMDVETIEEHLRDFAGKSGEIFERSYENSLLEVDIVSDKTARKVASFLAEHGVNVEALTAQTINGTISRTIGDQPKPLPVSTVIVQLTDVQSFDEERIIENALTQMVGENGRVMGEYDGNAKSLKIMVSFTQNPKTAREIAGFLNRPDVKALESDFAELKKHNVVELKVTGMSSDSVSGTVLHGVSW